MFVRLVGTLDLAVASHVQRNAPANHFTLPLVVATHASAVRFVRTVRTVIRSVTPPHNVHAVMTSGTHPLTRTALWLIRALISLAILLIAAILAV